MRVLNNLIKTEELDVSLNEFLPININYFLLTMKILNSKSKHFSLSSLFSNVYMNPNLFTTYAYDIIQNSTNQMTFVNLPFHSDLNILKIKGKNERVNFKNENFIPYGTMEYVMNSFEKSFIHFLLAIKIFSCSFFLYEVMEFSNFISSYSINRNIFFQNFNEFKEFAEIYEIFSPLLKGFYCETIHEAFHLVQKLFNFDFSIQTNFLIIHENVYCENGLIIDENLEINTNQYYLINLNSAIKEPKQRILKIAPCQDNTLFHYMKNELKLNYKSINHVFYKEIIEFFVDKPSQLFQKRFSEIVNFLESIKSDVIIIKNQLFLKKIPLFFYFTSTELEIIKKFSREKPFKEIAVINLNSFQESLIRISNNQLIKTILIY
jgi:hypothetical protein